MTTPSWPITVTNFILEDGYGEQPERNVASYEVDIGPALESRMSSVPGDIFEGVVRCVSSDNYDDFLDFYRDDLKDGVLPFTRTHPRTQAPGLTFQFMPGAFKLTSVKGDIHDVTVQMRWLR